MKNFVLNALLLLLALCPVVTVQAEEVTVTITTDSYTQCPDALRQTMERNLSRVLSEINLANNDNRVLNVAGLAMNDFAKGTLVQLWDNIHFYCDDSEVVDRLWELRNGYMLRQIPIIINPQGEQFGAGTYQECTVEFDRNGKITDFRFVFDTQLSESMERCGAVVELERKMQILKYCDRFRTAYCTKDIKYLEQVFSDDALIITGNVQKVKSAEGIMTEKVKYTQYNKQQYLTNLRRAFARNKYIDVQFSEIGENGEDSGCGTVTRSVNNKNMYGVRLRQEWRSSNYSDTGYLFLLWDFTDENAPVIHVRTWQPELVNGKKINDEEIFSLSDFDL
ncbi:MAG: hypothetical protein IKQ05_00140 [Prevotella sp.]|nr:hypothetical protein [Prevotella sp.]